MTYYKKGSSSISPIIKDRIIKAIQDGVPDTAITERFGCSRTGLTAIKAQLRKQQAPPSKPA